jgi:hypothetical protein
LAAWIVLVPRQNSSGGKERLGGITKRGDRYLRQMLVVGALSVIRYAQRDGTKRPWLVQLLARSATKIAGGAGQQEGQDDLGDHDGSTIQRTITTACCSLAAAGIKSLGRAHAM